MTGAVHASIGAAVGSLCKGRASAFLAGVVSHLVADMIPHKDFPPSIEVPLMAAAVTGIAAWRGTDSTEFWGTLGAIAPDSEHGLFVAGAIASEQRVFPTHISDGKYHGRESNERWSQFLITVAAVAVVAARARKRDTADLPEANESLPLAADRACA